MEAVISFFQPFFDWLLQTTVTASIVICLILASQKTLGGRLGPRWCHALWLVLLIRMVLPWAPSSRLSLSNLIPPWDQQAQPQQSPMIVEQQETFVAPETVNNSEAIPEKGPQSEATVGKGVAPKPQTPGNVEGKCGPRLASIRRLLPILWLAGAILIGAYILLSDLALWRIVKRDRPLVNQQMLELFEECKAQMGIQSLVVVVPSSHVKSPGLFGFVRPRLLLPQDMLNTATREEMRYVFLHELAHLRRHDIYLGWLASLLQILHWFNPLVWFAFYRMRADRELACDALVLTRTGQDKSHEYGGAILGLVRRFSRSRPLPAMAGVIESKSQLKRRIAMITQFRNNSYRWSPLATVLIVILACISLPDAMRTQASETSATKAPPALVVRQVWTGARDPDFMGAPSSDGKYVSYVDWTTGDLAVHELASGTNRNLTNEGWEKGWAQESVFSPDSKQIAYYWWNNEKGEAAGAELRIVGLDGSGPRVVPLDEGTYLRMPAAWSADGKQILALGSGKDRSVQILLIPVVDGKMRVLKTIPHHPGLWRYPSIRRKVGMSLSPDGRYVAYTYPPKQDSWECDIFLLAVDGSGETVLVEHPADDFVLGWAPDGRGVVFASDREGSMGIWAVEVADGKPHGTPHLLKPDVGLFHPMGFTPNGSYYYGVASGGNNIYVATYDPQRGNVTGEPVLAIKQYEGSNWAPDWSPDGRYLACVSKRPGAGWVFLIQSVETGEVRELSPNLEEFDVHSLRWFPDGRSLLCIGRAKDFPPGGILRIDVETGKATTIVSTVIRGGQFPNVTSDGKTMFDVSRGHNGWWIWHHDLTTGDRYPVFRAKVGEHGVGAILGLELSPDGKQLAFQDLDAGMLKVISVAGGQPRELAKVEDKITITWTPNGKHLLYAPRLGKSHSQLWRIGAERGEPQKLDLTMPLEHIRFHPDGRRIAFTAKDGTERIEVWTIENLLPQPEKTSVVTTRLVWPIGADLGGGKPSPDGRYLTFVDAQTGDVGLRELATGKSRLLTHEGSRWESDDERAFWPQISPDGERVVYTWSSRGQGWQLRVVGIDGSKPRIVYPRKDGHSDDEKIFPLTVGWLPDGKHVLVYQTKHSSDKSIQYQILLIPLADGPIRILKTFSDEPAKNRPERRYAMSLSPDGRYLAYSRERPESTSNRDIILLPLDGTEETALVTQRADDYVLGWTPDGQRLLFARQRNRSWDAWIVGVVDGKAQGSPELVRPNIGLVRPIGVTRDGSFYYVLHFPGGRLAVHTAQLDFEAGKVVALPVPAEKHTLGASGEPTWSPDGKYLAYWSRDGVSYRISILSTETGQVRQLDRKLNLYGALRWSPDGQSILTTAQPKLGGSFGVFQIDTETGDANTLVEPGQGAGRAAWSADGKGIFFAKDSGIVFRDLQTGSDKEILPHDRSGLDPVFMIDVSPDGRQVAVYGQETESKAMVMKVIPASGGEPRELLRLEQENPNRQPLAWTRDGQSLLLIRNGSEETRGLWRIPIDGGKCQRLELPWAGWFMDLSVHPDGQRIAFVADQRRKEEVWVMENFLPEAVAMGK